LLSAALYINLGVSRQLPEYIAKGELGGRDKNWEGSTPNPDNSYLELMSVHIYICQGCYVSFCLCLSVCQSVCPQDNSRNCRQILM